MKTLAIITMILISPIALCMVGTAVVLVGAFIVESWLILYHLVIGKELPDPAVPPAVMRMGQ